MSADDIEVIHMTAVEWDQALTNSLNDLSLTWEQLTEQAKTGVFSSLKARQLWLMAGGQGPNQADVELAGWKSKAEFAEGAAVNNRERADQFRQERDDARWELSRIRRALGDTYGEDYTGEDTAADVERLFRHLGEHDDNVQRILQRKNEAIEKAQTERDALKATIERVRNLDDPYPCGSVYAVPYGNGGWRSVLPVADLRAALSATTPAT